MMLVIAVAVVASNRELRLRLERMEDESDPM